MTLHAGLDDAVVRRLADLGAAEHVLELTDAVLDLALLVLGGVVAAVLLEVALVAGSADPLDDLLADRAAQLLQLGLELGEGLLGQPDGVVLESASCGTPDRVKGRYGVPALGVVSAVRRPRAGRPKISSLPTRVRHRGRSAARRLSAGSRLVRRRAADERRPRWPAARCGSSRRCGRRRGTKVSSPTIAVVLGERAHQAAASTPSPSATETRRRRCGRRPRRTDELRVDVRRRVEPGGPGHPAQEHRHHDHHDPTSTSRRRGRAVPCRSGRTGSRGARSTSIPASLESSACRPDPAGPRGRPAADARARPPRRRVEQGRGVHGQVRRRGRRRPRRHLHRRRARLDPQPQDGPPGDAREHRRGAPPGDGAGPRHPRGAPGLARLRRLGLARGRPEAAAARGLLRAWCRSRRRPRRWCGWSGSSGRTWSRRTTSAAATRTPTT